MKGYKAFNKDLTCKGYQFELDKTHIFDGEPILCKSGFHFCTELEDLVNYYSKPDMRVFEVEVGGTITEAEHDCSKRACSEIKLVKELNLDEVAQSITKSELAYYWARDVGDKDIMIDKITSRWAYYWARYIGDIYVMIDRIIESEWAYRWARNIGNRDIMIDRITEPQWALRWIYHFGDKDKQYFIDKGLI